MLEDKKYWKLLKSNITVTEKFQRLLLILVTGVFPILIGILTNLWTNNTSQNSLAGWFLLFVAILQIVLGIYTVVSKSICPEAAMVGVLEAEEQVEFKTAELARREEAYRLIRTSFNELNSQTCKLSQEDPNQKNWCKAGFETSLTPIVETLLRNIHKVAGVKSSVYSLEIYFDLNTRLSLDALPPEEALYLSFFFGSSVTRDKAINLTKSRVSPGLHVYLTNTAFAQNISANKHLYFDGNEPRTNVYFRNFATTPLYPACSTAGAPLGAVLLTSMQDEPFATDVLDTLAFFASMVSTFLFSYQDLPLPALIRSNGTK